MTFCPELILLKLLIKKIILDILKEEKLAPPSVLNELDIKITNKNFQKIFCDYYFYIQEIYSASWNYLLDGDKNYDKYI